MYIENFKIGQFKRKDYPEYKSWFSDSRISTALGDIDLEWLEFVQKDKTAQEFAIRQNGTLLAVAGVVFPIAEKPAYVISNIAVNPDFMQKGIGSKVLVLILQQFKLKSNEYWLAYVERENEVAQSFFERNGWRSINDEGEGMLTYRFV